MTDLLGGSRSEYRLSRTALNLGLQAERKRLRIFGLGGSESYRELRLEVMLLSPPKPGNCSA